MHDVGVRQAAADSSAAYRCGTSCAGLPVAFGTSHVALKERARLQPGQTVLVLGAAGGVGIAAVQARAAAEAHAHASQNGGRGGWGGRTDELGAAAADCQGTFFVATQCRCGEAACGGCRASQIRKHDFERPRLPAAASAPGRAGQRWATASPTRRSTQRKTACGGAGRLPKVMGARVVAVCRGAAKADALRSPMTLAICRRCRAPLGCRV